MDFLKLVQKKEQKIDNRIVTIMLILLVMIISVIVFWPSRLKHQIFTYLPDNTSFYYHWTTQKYLTQAFFIKENSKERVEELEVMLDNNFLNLQEVLWFQIDTNVAKDNYILRFSRLPRSFLEDFNKKEYKYKAVILEKNILLLSSEPWLDNLEPNEEKPVYFNDGVSIFWQKNKAPDFLKDLASVVEPIFVEEDILLNWQRLAKDKNKLSLLENRVSETKGVNDFLALKDFDLVFGFRKGMSSQIAEDFSVELLKTFFDALPYYSLSEELIKNRLLNDTMLWQKDDGWVLASDRGWQEDILDFMDYFIVEEVAGALQDGTAYVELVASSEQNITEHNINGQKVFQIADLFIWDIANQHYLSNRQELIAELSSNNRRLGAMIANCLNEPARIGDFLYIKDKAISEQSILDYLDTYSIEDLEVFSYATGTISGLSVCF